MTGSIPVSWGIVDCTANFPVGDFNAVSRLSDPHEVTSARLSEMRASCLASWQSPSSSIQCFHWDRLYSGMSAGIGATVIAREVVGVGVAVVSS